MDNLNRYISLVDHNSIERALRFLVSDPHNGKINKLDIVDCIDEFNLCINDDLTINSDVVSTDRFSQFVITLFSDKIFCDPKYLNLKKFAVKNLFGGSFLTSYMRYANVINPKECYQIYKFLKEELHYNVNGILTIPSLARNMNTSEINWMYTFIMVCESSDLSNIVRMILNEVSSNKLTIFKYITLSYKSLEYSDNFKDLLELLMSNITQFKLFYNSNSIPDAIRDFKINSSDIEEALEYCRDSGIITNKDYNFYFKGIARSAI